MTDWDTCAHIIGALGRRCKRWPAEGSPFCLRHMTETTLPPVTISDETRGHLQRIAKRRQKLDTEWRDAIRQAVAEGGTLREVGDAAGISHTAVKFIVYGRPEK